MEKLNKENKVDETPIRSSNDNQNGSIKPIIIKKYSNPLPPNHYFIYCKMGPLYLVKVKDNDVIIYEREAPKEKYVKYIPIKQALSCIKVFIPECATVDKNQKSTMKGANIVFLTSENKYFIVCWSILQFTPLDEIVDFKFNLIENKRPIPFAIDSRGRYYLFGCNLRLDEVPQEYVNTPDKYWSMCEEKKLSLKRNDSPAESLFLNTYHERDYLEYYGGKVRPNTEKMEKEIKKRYLQDMLTKSDGEHIMCNFVTFTEEEKKTARINTDNFKTFNKILVPLEEYREIEDMCRGDPIPSYRLYIKDDEGKWNLTSFEEYAKLQTLWREKVKCHWFPTINSSPPVKLV